MAKVARNWQVIAYVQKSYRRQDGRLYVGGCVVVAASRIEAINKARNGEWVDTPRFSPSERVPCLKGKGYAVFVRPDN